MDDDALNMRNWGYYEPSFKGHLNLQLMSTMAERDTKPFIGRDPNHLMVSANGGGFHHGREHPVVSDGTIPFSYPRESWMNPREKLYGMMPANPHYSPVLLPQTSSAAPNLQILPMPDPSRLDKMVKLEEPEVKKENSQGKKRQRLSGDDTNTNPNTIKAPKPKKPRKPKDSPNPTMQRPKPPKKSMELVINGIGMDISGIPIPICSCTGTPQQCYRWGCGGWQSACCTTQMSVYPLPMSTKRRGARIAGRKMSQGAFKKVLEKLAAEGYNFANPIDLRTHWAKHGTNKFVTIR